MTRHQWLLGVGLLAVVAWVFPITSARGLYVRPELTKIPVDRLVDNLQQIAKNKPKDFTAHLNVARAHAMAYALKTDTAQILQGKIEKGAWFGYEPRHVPFRNVKTTDKKKLAAAKKHLKASLAWYDKALKLKPDNLTALLGHAWMTEHGGTKKEAIKEYRKVIENAWKNEENLKVAGLGWHSVTSEAAGYLIPLLDKKEDAKEIADLNERVKKMRRVARPVTPIAIPLKAGLSLKEALAPETKVKFDLDGSGYRRSWSWISPKAGWLVHDPNSSGKITSGLQMFGSVTFWMFWDNGYQALSALDDNHDGRLTKSELRGLAIWQDLNSNGISEVGEVKTLAEHGIVELSCQAQRSKSRNCVAQAVRGVKFREGTWRATWDVILHESRHTAK